VERFVKNVAIEAPVAPKDKQYAFMGGGRGAQRFGNFPVRIHVLRIDLLVFERLAEAGGSGPADDPEVPLVALPEPVLLHGDELLGRSSSLLEGEGKLNNDGVDVRTRLVLLNDLRGQIGESLGLPGGPESYFLSGSNGLLARTGDLRGGRLRVKRGNGRRIAGKDGGPPFLKGREGGGRGKLARVDGRGKGKNDQKNGQAAHGFVN